MFESYWFGVEHGANLDFFSRRKKTNKITDFPRIVSLEHVLVHRIRFSAVLNVGRCRQVYEVNWQQADGKPIRFRTEDRSIL